MTTYSQLVDSIMSRLASPHLQSKIEPYINQTIRELHSNPRGFPILFGKNLLEDTLTTTTDDEHIWTPPTGMQKFRTARYDTVFDRDSNPVYPKPIRPGRAITDQLYYYYQSGTSIVFANPGSAGATISIAYYLHLSRLKYYAAAARPAEYDSVDGWTYYDLTGSGGLDYTESANNATAQALVSNWMLLDWEDAVAEGATHKVYKGKKDEERARTHFSQFQANRTQLTTTEESETLGA